jgi:hypothetical protein
MASPLIPQPPEPGWAANPQPYQGPDPIGHAIANVLTLGAAAHPGAAASYWSGQLHAFDPSSSIGAMNLATLLVPGARGDWAGRPTADQSMFLNSIYQQSRGEGSSGTGGSGWVRLGRQAFPSYRWNPGVRSLAEQIGAPASPGIRTNAGLPIPETSGPLDYQRAMGGVVPGASAHIPYNTNAFSGLLEGGMSPSQFASEIGHAAGEAMPPYSHDALVRGLVRELTSNPHSQGLLLGGRDSVAELRNMVAQALMRASETRNPRR